MRYATTIGLAAVLACCSAGMIGAEAKTPVVAATVFVRGQNLVVCPSTGPVWSATVYNTSAKPFAGELKVTFPEGWKTNRTSCTVTLAAGEAKNFDFAIEKATDRKSNAYPFILDLTAPGVSVRREQTIVCATAPYGRPTIDGKADDWKDVVPISFSGGAEDAPVRVMAFWSKKTFSLCVEVTENALTVCDDPAKAALCDALQFSLSPESVLSPAAAPAKTLQRYEYLVLPRKDGVAEVRKLAWVGDAKPEATPSSKTPSAFSLLDGAKATVTREGKLTRYELSIPLRTMKALKATTGRVFGFSLLVHDAAPKSAIRDLGNVMNLLPMHRRVGAWTRLANFPWSPKTKPWTNRIEFGFSSSIH